MAGFDVLSIDLDPADRDILAKAARQLCRYDFVTQAEEFGLEAQLRAALLTEPLRRGLLRFRRFGHPSGGMLVRGVPTGVVRPTPLQVSAGDTPRDGAAAMSLVISLLGDQYGFRPELGGALIQNILPVSGFETQQISTGSLTDLDSHVEMAFSPLRSDYVALLCVRADHEHIAGTTLSAIDAILEHLDERTVDLLRQPRFRTKVDVSFMAGEQFDGDIWIDPISLLEGPACRPWLRVDLAESEGKDTGARHAFNSLRKAILSAQTIVRLDVGDLLIVDNHRAVHGRTPFVPRYDGRDRWLLRSFVTKDLRLSEPSRPEDGRIVDLDYGVMSSAKF